MLLSVDYWSQCKWNHLFYTRYCCWWRHHFKYWFSSNHCRTTCWALSKDGSLGKPFTKLADRWEQGTPLKSYGLCPWLSWGYVAHQTVQIWKARWIEVCLTSSRFCWSVFPQVVSKVCNDLRKKISRDEDWLIFSRHRYNFWSLLEPTVEHNHFPSLCEEAVLEADIFYLLENLEVLLCLEGLQRLKIIQRLQWISRLSHFMRIKHLGGIDSLEGIEGVKGLERLERLDNQSWASGCFLVLKKPKTKKQDCMQTYLFLLTVGLDRYLSSRHAYINLIKYITMSIIDNDTR